MAPGSGSVAKRANATGVFCAVLALTGKAVGGEIAKTMVTLKESEMVLLPSVTVTVTVNVPVCPVSGTMGSSPLAPFKIPLSVNATVMFVSCTRPWSELVALTMERI